MVKQHLSKIIIGGVVGLIAIGAIVAIVKNNNRAKELEQIHNAEATRSLAAPVEEGPTPTIVLYTALGFNPATTTIKKGTTIQFKNNSNNAFWPASNNHPVHNIYPDFDAKRPIIPGQSFTFTFTKDGEWPYHNHLHSSQGGLIIVD